MLIIFDVVQEVLTKNNVEIVDIEDKRTPINLNFTPVTERYWADQGVVGLKDIL